MTPITQANVVSDAKKLANEILTDNVDRFESGLLRTVTRVVSFVFGSVIHLGGTCLVAMDAERDARKIRLIQTHMDQLNKIKSPSKTEQKAIRFQQKVCEKIENYTKDAQTIKIMTAAASWALTCSMVAAWPFMTAPKDFEHIAPIAIAAHATVAGVICGFLVWSFGGIELNTEKRALALQAKADLAETV